VNLAGADFQGGEQIQRSVTLIPESGVKVRGFTSEEIRVR
jgi:hypothetical protein